MKITEGAPGGPNPLVNTTGGWRPELVSWNTTQRCNLRCDHCYLAAGSRAPEELSFEEGCNLIDQLSAAGTQMLILTGGEPLMRRDIIDLAAYASSKGLVTVLGTNGMLLTPARVQQLKTAGVGGVGISLDSMHPEKHDGFRGVPGAWEGAVRGIRVCVAERVPVLVQMTVLPWNFAELERMIEFAHEEGASAFTLYFLVCTGRGEKLSDISPQQYEDALSSLIRAQPRYPHMMVRARCAPQISRLASQGSSALIGNVGCVAGRQYCRITPEGAITPCPYLPLEAGDVRQRSFSEIWQDAELFQELRKGPPRGRCGKCEFSSLCGGCRARAFALAGDVLEEDPWCPYQPSGQRAPEQRTSDHREVIPWTPEADQRLQRIPPFVRSRVKTAVERYAQANGEREITTAVMTATLEKLGRSLPFQRPRPADSQR